MRLQRAAIGRMICTSKGSTGGCDRGNGGIWVILASAVQWLLGIQKRGERLRAPMAWPTPALVDEGRVLVVFFMSSETGFPGSNVGLFAQDTTHVAHCDKKKRKPENSHNFGTVPPKERTGL